jgi:hypothetical protein
MPEEKKEKQIKVRCPEDLINGKYVNLSMANFSEEEFILDFMFLQPGGKNGDVRSRVIMNPKHAKRLVQMLVDNLDKYQQKFGVLDSDESDDESEDIPPFTISFN